MPILNDSRADPVVTPTENRGKLNTCALTHRPEGF